ncbi:hypothetical protein Btru_042259 [Bulinus truncatus]|nr:hypothetical protein Btru_042259 [Bulinus truncatus]
MVKLLHGWVPAIECGFTGTLLLRDVAPEETIVASTFYREVAVSLEIPLESDVKFQVAILNDTILSSEQWVNALRHCKANAPNYTKAMKVIGPEGSVDIDDSDLDIRSCGLQPEDPRPGIAGPAQLPSPRTPERDLPDNDTVQLRRTLPGTTSGQYQVKHLSKRVGVYAMNHSYNTRELTVKRKARKNAFREGRMGRQRPKTTPETLPRYGNANGPKYMPPYPGNNTEEEAISIPGVIGAPVQHFWNRSTEYANVDDDPLYTPRHFPGGYEELDSDGPCPPRRTRSCVCHLIQQDDGGIFAVSPFTRNEEVQDEGYWASDTEDGRSTLFLFHGSIQSEDDYIHPVDGTHVNPPLSPDPGFRPQLPPRRPRPRAPLANAEFGCYNRQMLIEELKKATPVSATEELALKSLTMLDISMLLSGPTDDLENMLLSLAPKISPQNVKNITLFFKTFRGKVGILTEF